MDARPALPDSPRRRLRPAGHALVVGVVALVVGTLLNAQALLASAERQVLGSPLRSITVEVMEPIAALSEAAGLDAPRNIVEHAIGRDGEPGELQAATPPPATPAPAPPPSVPIAPATAEPAPPRVVDAADPLKLWLVADSFGELFGPALVNRSEETDLIEAEYDFRFITGLTRPDYFDWPAHVASRLPEVSPDAVVVMFGGNDGAPIEEAGQIYDVGSEGWKEVYRQRVGEMMDALLTAADRVYWVGMPIMKSDTFTAKVEMMNGLYRAEAEERRRVEYVDIWELFQDSSGRYATYLPDDDGELVRMRAPDNAHFWWGGAYRLADHVLPLIAAEWGFAYVR